MDMAVDLNINNFDIEKLRSDLISYYNNAMFTVNPIAIKDMQQIQKATDEEVLKKAIELKIDLRNYIKQKTL